MKNRFFVLGLAALSISTAQAQTIPTETLPTARLRTSSTLVSPNAPAPTFGSTKSQERLQAVTYTDMYSNDYACWFEQYSTNQTFVYDKGTNTLMLVHPVRVFSGQTFTGGKIEAITSVDGGTTWTKKNLFEKNGDYRAFPHLGLVNKGTTTTADLNWVLYASSYQRSGTSWPYVGKVGYFKLADPAPMDVPLESPDANNDGGYIFDNSALVTTTGANAGAFYAGRLGAVQSTTGQYGAYGQWFFNFVSEDIQSSLPPEWGLSNWKAGTPNSTYNSEMLTDADQNGHLYVAVDNLWAADEESRLPGVSWSMDNGLTWSPWYIMPKTALESYATANFTDAKYAIYDAYGGDGFTVTGTEQYSYVYRIGHIDDQNRFDRLDLIEAEYKTTTGTWTVRKICELNDFNPLTFIANDTASASKGKWIPYVSSVLGHEVQVSKTADGQYLIAKWVDANVNLPKFGSAAPIDILYNNNNVLTYGQLDSLFTTDVYYSIRKIGEDTWSTPVNITNDAKVDKGTRIPPVVPSADKVPLMYHQGITNAQIPANHPLKNAGWPDAFVERELGNTSNSSPASVGLLPQTVRVGVFNALNPSAVNEDQAYSFSLNNAKPNPATNMSEISFTMDVAGKVSLDLFDVLGNKVRGIVNGNLDAGIHAVSIESMSLSNGTYYFTLNVNGKSITKTLVVMN